MANWLDNILGTRPGGAAGGGSAKPGEEPSATAFSPYVDLVRATFHPILAEIDRDDSPTAETDRALRRILHEAISDVEGGLTELTSRRNGEAIQDQLKLWFTARAASYKSKADDLGAVIATMGTALRALQGGAGDFHGDLQRALEEMKETQANPTSRAASGKLLRLIDGAIDRASHQKQETEKRLRSLSDAVHTLHEELNRAKVQLQEDALTGVFNRGSLDLHLQALFNKLRVASLRFAIVMVDLDHFKHVNDTYGHLGGDRVLQAAAKTMQKVALRRTDFIGRYGGEEFCVVLGDTDTAGGATIAERLRLAFAATEVPIGAQVVKFTASLGVAEVQYGDTAETLIERADKCLYHAKGAGRNRVSAWGPRGPS